MNTQPSQSGVFPIFYTTAKQSKQLTDQNGYPSFVDVEMVEIRIPGDNKTVVHQKVSEEHKQRWPQHYEAFKKGQDAPTNGLPLKHCPLFTNAQVATMRAQNIHTVEALAELPDSFITRLGMGARGWVAKAKAYLKDAEGTAEVTKLASENEHMRSEIEMLKRQIQEMGNNVVQLQPSLEDRERLEEKGREFVDALIEKELPSTFEEAGFSNRTMNALRNEGIETIDELMQFSIEDIGNIKGIGITAIDEITRLSE
jgi:hypothetical protein